MVAKTSSSEFCSASSLTSLPALSSRFYMRHISLYHINNSKYQPKLLLSMHSPLRPEIGTQETFSRAKPVYVNKGLILAWTWLNFYSFQLTVSILLTAITRFLIPKFFKSKSCSRTLAGVFENSFSKSLNLAETT
jgi:hypothetical protein